MRKVLILCTGNSCRSILAEALVNHHLGDSWTAFSAGTEPSAVNPCALQVLKERGIATDSLRSKSVAEFLQRDDLDLVITVCDHAKESCPVFARPVPTLHLGIEDPAPHTNDPDALEFFRRTREQILAKVIARLRNT